MTLSQLSDNLSDAGRPMAGNTVSTIETMARRVDVDDLVAFATALNVSPAALLMPVCEEDDSDDYFEVEAWRRVQVPKFAWQRSWVV